MTSAFPQPYLPVTSPPDNLPTSIVPLKTQSDVSLTSYRDPREKRMKVCVRVRPLTPRDMKRPGGGGKLAWTWHDNTLYQQIFPAEVPIPTADNSTTLTSETRRRGVSSLPSSYAFDYLYPPAVTTQSIYNDIVKDKVIAAMEGYHSSIFVYGQTGTGKTHTIQGTDTDAGIIPLAVSEIFDHINQHPNFEYLLRFSYMEIYNEQIFDLLRTDDHVQTDIKIYEVDTRTSDELQQGKSRDKDVVVDGLKEELIVSPSQLLALVQAGNRHRHMGATSANTTSSRSHTFFRLIIEHKVHRDYENNNEGTPVRSAMLNLVDLAGSEGVRLAQTSGTHAEEGKYINQSLLTLGNIIWKLSQTSVRKSRQPGAPPKKLHLPYRNSKLTRILQPCLSGQAQMAVICTITPTVECLAETHNTLKFANFARRVKNRAVLNETNGDLALLTQYHVRRAELVQAYEGLRMQRDRNGTFHTMRPTGLSALDDRMSDIDRSIKHIDQVILHADPHGPQYHYKLPTPLDNNNGAMDPENEQEYSNDPTMGPRQYRPPLIPDELQGGKVLRKDARYRSLRINPNAAMTSGKIPMQGTVPKHQGGMPQASPSHGTGGPTTPRPSLTSVLKEKYIAELQKLENESTESRPLLSHAPMTGDDTNGLDRPTVGDDSDLFFRDLLREFIHVLEVAEAEQDTRSSRIIDLEISNRQLRQILQVREQELNGMRTQMVQQSTHQPHVDRRVGI